MLTESNLSLKYWPYAFRAAEFIANRTPVTGQEKTPLEMFSGMKPRVDMIRVFGSVCYAKKQERFSKGRFKIQPRAEKCIMLGYTQGGHSYVVQSTSTKRIFPCTHVFDFQELGEIQKPITTPTPAKPIPARKTLQISTESDDGFPEQTPDLPVEPRDDNESGGDSSDVASEEDSESGGDDAEDDEFNDEDPDNAEDAEELISENNSNLESPTPSIEATPSADDSSPLEQQHTSPVQPTTPAASSRRFPPALTPEQYRKCTRRISLGDLKRERDAHLKRIGKQMFLPRQIRET
jgi:hypothetical protein